MEIFFFPEDQWSELKSPQNGFQKKKALGALKFQSQRLWKRAFISF